MPDYARERARERICISLLRALAHRSLPGWICNMQTCRHNQSPSLSLSSIALSGRSFCSNNILCAANHTSFHTHASCIMHCVSQSIIRTRVKLFAIWHEYQFWNSPRTRTGMSEQRERERDTNEQQNSKTNQTWYGIGWSRARNKNSSSDAREEKNGFAFFDWYLPLLYSKRNETSIEKIRRKKNSIQSQTRLHRIDICVPIVCGHRARALTHSFSNMLFDSQRPTTTATQSKPLNL